MKLIRAGIQKAEQQACQKRRPSPLPRQQFAEETEGGHGKHGKFCHMRIFPEVMVHPLIAQRRQNPQQQPAEGGLHEPGAEPSGFGAVLGGKQENHEHHAERKTAEENQAFSVALHLSIGSQTSGHRCRRYLHRGSPSVPVCQKCRPCAGSGQKTCGFRNPRN